MVDRLDSDERCCMSLRYVYNGQLSKSFRSLRAAVIGTTSYVAFSTSTFWCEEGKTKPSSSSWLPSIPDLPSIGEARELVEEWKGRVQEAMKELSRDEGSLYRKLVDEDRSNAELHPEIALDANVRVDRGKQGPDSLPHGEKAFLRQRRKRAAKAFASYIGVDEVDPRDVPIIGVAGSGGGYRAMVNLAGNLRAARDSGLFDCVTAVFSDYQWRQLGLWYAAQAAFDYCSTGHTGLLYSLARGDIDRWLEHMKQNIQTPFLHPSILDPLITKPSNSYLLASPVFKEAAEAGSVGLVDAYGLLVSTRLFLPGQRAPDSKDLKISQQRRYFEDGEMPMPIYNLVWHNVPAEQLSDEEREGAKKADNNVGKMRDQAATSELKDRWLWFEATAWEVGSEEIGAYCPTYAFGRRFENGQSIERQPELQLTVLNGLFASAFTATLFQYISEVKPVLQMLGTAIFGRLDGLLNTYKDELLKLHPVPPASIPNFTRHLGSKLRQDAPTELNDAENIGLLDAGAYCNVPYFPLFRRQCDVILAFDASADSQELWFERAQKYAAARDLSGWPRIAFPSKAPAEAQKQAESASSPAPTPGSTTTSREASQKTASASQETAAKMPAPEEDNADEPPIGRAAIWVGSSDDQPSRLDEPTVEEVMKRDGIALAYFPLVGDEGLKEPDEDWSTWRFEYKPSETDALLDLAGRNFATADDRLRVLLRGVWERKRRDRLAKK